MTSPSYPTPIPQRHLPTILSVCHFTPEERDAFLAAYRTAHRGKLDLAKRRTGCAISICWCPISATTKTNMDFERAVSEFVASVGGMIRRAADD